MINCLKCELTRAKVRAAAMAAFGRTPEYIASELTKTYGSAYYIVIGSGKQGWTKLLMRESKQHPFEPHEVKVFYGI